MKNLVQILAAAIAEKNLPVLLIGGHALAALGHPRSTFDLDLLISAGDSPAWEEILSALGYRLFSPAGNFRQFSPPENRNLPPVDLMLVNPETFAALWERRISGPQIPAIDPIGMIALKLHAIRQPLRREKDKDWSDILALIDIHHLTLDDPEFSAIVQKHGGPEAVEKITRHLAR